MGRWGCCEAGDVAYSMYLVDDDPQYICSLYHIKPFVDVTYEMYIKRKFDPALDFPSILLLLSNTKFAVIDTVVQMRGNTSICQVVNNASFVIII
jgi:hypothetical protein